MFHYDEDNNILTIKRRDIKPIKDNDILKDIKDSYNAYKAKDGTIAQDVQYLFDKLASEAKLNFSIETEVKVGDLCHVANSYNMKPRDLYYPVSVRLRAKGDEDWSSYFELLHLPYMDSRGVLNFDASLKVLINFLSPSEDVSCASSGTKVNKINVYSGKRNLPFEIMGSDRIVLKIGKKAKAELDDVILALLRAENPDLPNDELLKKFDVLHNAAITYMCKCRNGYEAATAYANAKCINTLIYSKDYAMSFTARHNLNMAMQLDRAVGETLSRDVMDDVTGELLIPAGTFLTPEHIKLMKKHLVWKIYVKRKPKLHGMKLANPDILYICEGCRVGKLIESKLGSLLGGAKYVPKGLGLGSNAFSKIENGDAAEAAKRAEMFNRFLVSTAEYKNVLNEDLIEFYHDMGRTEPVQVVKSGEILTMELDSEIITNQTFLESDFKPGGSNRVWYTFDRNGELVRQTACLDTAILNDEAEEPEYYCFIGDRLNSRDLMAIYSIAGWYIAHPDVRILPDKDNSFLKVVSLFNEVYSDMFRAAADAYYKTNKTALKKKLTASGLYSLNSQDMYGFRKLLREKLFTSKSVETADTLNPVAVLSQVSNISTVVVDKNSVAEQQRLLVLPFYGRVCPYETPSSSKIGLVNHKAMGCKIVDKQLLSAFRRVHKRGDVAYVNFDEEPVWLSAKEQATYKITDILSVKFLNDGSTIDATNVLAMIPNMSRTGDAITVESIPSNTLDFITCFPEQHCSATAMLMPFLGADDPARISFGLSMQKQAIFCQENQKPRVLTSQYRDMFSSMPYYTVIAEADGVIHRITDNAIEVKYTTTSTTNLGRRETFKTTAAAILELGLYVGETFKAKTEIVMVDCVSDKSTKTIPAPFNCKIVDINEETNEFVVEETDSGPSLTAKHELPCQSIIINGQSVTFMEYDKVPGQSFKKGDMLAHASIVKEGFYAPSRNVLVAYMPTGYNYEDAVDMSQDCASHYTSISMHKQDIINVAPFGREKYDLITERSYVHDGGQLAKLIARGVVDLDNPDNSRTPIVRYQADKASGYVYSYYREIEKFKDKGKQKTTYHISLLSFNNQKPGDKMAGRHGNKGVASRVCKNSRMPMLKNGKVVDVCLNPCGVPSRMNLGQNLEAHLGFVAELFDVYILSDPFNGAELNDIIQLMHFAYEVANSSPTTWASLVSKYGLPANFTNHLLKNVDRIKEWEGVFNPDGTAEMWDPETQRWLEFPIAFGYAYFLKLEQEVDEKIHVREGLTSETYNECSQQPQQGRAHGGGQKFGEMELVTLAAYGATEFLHESTNEKSDNVGARYNMTAEVLGTSKRRAPTRECAPRANDILRYELEAAGVYTVVDGDEENIYPIDFETSNARERYSGNAVTRDARMGKNMNEENTAQEVAVRLEDLLSGLEGDS